MELPLIQLFLAAFLAYLLGSMPTAMIISKIQNLKDPRKLGSGNAGATNMMRLHGWPIALITLAGDVFKGFLAIKLYQQFLGSNPTHLATITFAVIVGHIYPVFFGFKGGKGVATILGTMLALSPILALLTLSCWILAFIITRVSAYSALICALIAPVIAYGYDNDQLLIWGICSLTLLLSHRENVRNLINNKPEKDNY